MNIAEEKPGIFTRIIDKRESTDPWIVMVHGYTHNHTYFSRQIQDFNDAYRLFLVDLRGHGRSAGIPGPYGVEEYADDILSVLDETGIENVHFWGTHTGSAIGLVMALRRPRLFHSLILEGTFLPGFPMPRVGELIARARSMIREKGLQAARDDWFDNADWFSHINRFPERCRAQEHRAMLNDFDGGPWLCDLEPRSVTPVADQLSVIKQPVLVYNGVNDLEDFKKAALFLEEGLTAVRREVIPDAGGFPAWENPDIVNHMVRLFLEGLTA